MKVQISDLNKFLTCPLCEGYFRECHTITECIHSFCKSCLIDHIYPEGQKSNLSCPTCNVNLGMRPFAKVIYDRNIQAIVDKIYPILLNKLAPATAATAAATASSSSSSSISKHLLDGKEKGVDAQNSNKRHKRGDETDDDHNISSNSNKSGVLLASNSSNSNSISNMDNSSKQEMDEETVIVRVVPRQDILPLSRILPAMSKPAFQMKVSVTMKKVKFQISKRLALLDCIVSPEDVLLYRDKERLHDDLTARELTESKKSSMRELVVSYERK